VHFLARLMPLLALATLLAGCGERRWSVPSAPALGWRHAGATHLPLRIAPDLVIKRIQFGTLETGADGEDRFTASRELPAEEGRVFGWVLELETTRPAVRWQEHLRLPRAPADWGDAGEDPDVEVSRDGASAMAQGEDLVEGGKLSRFYWSLAAGDPAGDYELDVAVEGRPVGHFVFKVPSPVQEKAILVRNGGARAARRAAHMVPVVSGRGATLWR